jgi:hypothetical protein
MVVVPELVDLAMDGFTSKEVTIVRNPGKPTQTTRKVRMYFDAAQNALFDFNDRLLPNDQIRSELFQETQVVKIVRQHLVRSDVNLWLAELMPITSWERLDRETQSCQWAYAEPLFGKQQPPGQYPKDMYRENGVPVKARDENEEAAARAHGYTTTFVPNYPAVKYHWTRNPLVVENSDQETALGRGWSRDHLAFDSYRVARKAKPHDPNPIKWVDEWLVPDLSAADRAMIKAALWQADAVFWKLPSSSSADMESMRLAFDGIAAALFDAGILTESLLENDIPTLVWDSAISGGWFHYASGTDKDIFPEKIGHHWVWRDESRDWQGLFRAESSRWRSELLQTSTPALPTRVSDGSREKGDRVEGERMESESHAPPLSPEEQEKKRAFWATKWEALSPEDRASIERSMAECSAILVRSVKYQKGLLRRLGVRTDLEDTEEFWIQLRAVAHHVGFSFEEFWHLTPREICASLELKATELERLERASRADPRSTPQTMNSTDRSVISTEQPPPSRDLEPATAADSATRSTNIEELMSSIGQSLTPERLEVLRAALPAFKEMQATLSKSQIRMLREAGAMEISVEEFRSRLPGLLQELGLEIPAGVLQPPRGRPGRPPSATTKSIHAEWVKMGKPSMTAPVCDRIASEFFPDEVKGITRGSSQHRKVRERVRQALQRFEQRTAT